EILQFSNNYPNFKNNFSSWGEEDKNGTKYVKIDYAPNVYIEKFLNCEVPSKCTWGGPRYEYVIRNGDKSYLVKGVQPTITKSNHLIDFYGNIWFLEGYKLKKLE
ncbi:MAG: hypothetical protein O2871_04015, partial [bacterium]|nr:hypothetical protein [bacterium]